MRNYLHRIDLQATYGNIFLINDVIYVWPTSDLSVSVILDTLHFSPGITIVASASVPCHLGIRSNLYITFPDPDHAVEFPEICT